MQRVLFCVPLAMSLGMAAYGYVRVQQGAVLFDFSAMGGLLGFVSIIIGGHGFFKKTPCQGQARRHRSVSRFFYLLLCVAGIGAVSLHGSNLKQAKVNYERLRMQMQRSTTQAEVDQ